MQWMVSIRDLLFPFHSGKHHKGRKELPGRTWLPRPHSSPPLRIVFSRLLLLSLCHLDGQIWDESDESVCWWKLIRATEDRLCRSLWRLFVVVVFFTMCGVCIFATVCRHCEICRTAWHMPRGYLLAAEIAMRDSHARRCQGFFLFQNMSKNQTSCSSSASSELVLFQPGDSEVQFPNSS